MAEQSAQLIRLFGFIEVLGAGVPGHVSLESDVVPADFVEVSESTVVETTLSSATESIRNVRY